MSKYYVMADLRREPAEGENLPPVAGAQVYAGRIKAVVERPYFPHRKPRRLLQGSDVRMPMDIPSFGKRV